MLLTYPDQPLVAGSIRVRPWRDEDLSCVEAATKDPEIPRGTTVPRSFTIEAGLSFIQRQRARLTDGTGISQAIADVDTDQAVGLIYLAQRPQLWIAGLGYWLVPGARGQHRAAAAIRVVSDWALTELDICRLEAWVDPDNVPSRRVLEHTGFELEGRLRNYLRLADQVGDGLVYSRVGPGPALASAHWAL